MLILEDGELQGTIIEHRGLTSEEYTQLRESKYRTFEDGQYVEISEYAEDIAYEQEITYDEAKSYVEENGALIDIIEYIYDEDASPHITVIETDVAKFFLIAFDDNGHGNLIVLTPEEKKKEGK
jgi:hypothetical protein